MFSGSDDFRLYIYNLNPYADYLPTGKILLGANDSDVTKIPAKTSKVLSYDKFERTYETAFGKFHFLMAPDNIVQELSRPGTNVKVISTSDQSIWQLTTHNYELQVTQDPDETIEHFSSADGSITRVKQNGGINETYEGFDPEILLTDMEDARSLLTDEVGKMEQIKLQTIVPELGVGSSSSYQLPGGGSVNGSTSSNGIRITNIDYAAEWVEVTNTGSSLVNLGGWTLSDKTTHIFTFPTGFSLNSSESVRVFSGAAKASCVTSTSSLCWTGTNIWDNAGDTATLRTSSGVIASTYTYPTAS